MWRVTAILATALLAQAPDWPIRPILVRLDGLERGTHRESIDCQPEVFDPATWTRIPDPEAHGTQFMAPGDNGCRIVVDGYQASGDHKITLRAPFAVTMFYFFDGAEGKHVLELRKNGARHALYTHIEEFRFSRDSRTLVLINTYRSSSGWMSGTRIIDIATKNATVLPNVPCVDHIADADGNRVITYDDYDHACIWDLGGQLVGAYDVPSLLHSNEGRIGDNLGLLPAQRSSLFFVYRPDENGCAVLLQEIGRPAHRRLSFPHPHQAPLADDDVDDFHSCSPGTGLEVDWADLTVEGGHMRYRISKSHRGDLLHDWGPWLIAR